MKSKSELPRTLTLILAGGQGERLLPLTAGRPKPAVPFGGAFRIIDFTLSNCFNSGLRQLCLLTQYKHEVLHGYVRDGWGSLWNRLRSGEGEFLNCLPPVAGKRYRGTADAVFHNIEFIEEFDPEFVLVLSGDHIYHMDYRDLLEDHAASRADATIATVQQPVEEARRFGVVETDANGHVTGFVEKPEPPFLRGRGAATITVNMGVYAFKTKSLILALKDASRVPGRYDFGRHILPAMIATGGVRAHRFGHAAGVASSYWKDIGTVDAYYESNMDLVRETPPFDPSSNKHWPTHTIGERAAASAAVHGEVVNSMLFPGVRVAEDARVSDSVVLKGARIGARAQVRRAIVEEGAEIPAGSRIGFNDEDDRARYFVTESGVVVVTPQSCEPMPVLLRASA